MHGDANKRVAQNIRDRKSCKRTFCNNYDRDLIHATSHCRRLQTYSTLTFKEVKAKSRTGHPDIGV